MTPPHLRSSFYVIKALSKNKIPLCFGSLHPAFPEHDLPHPIA
jgi:hypothetical protein